MAVVNQVIVIGLRIMEYAKLIMYKLYKLQYSLSKTAKQKVLFTIHDCHCCP